MTGTQVIERQITRQLLGYGNVGNAQQPSGRWADRLIAVLAVTAGLLVAGSMFEELLWAALGTATLVTLR